MDLTPYLTTLREDLLAAAEIGDDRLRDKLVLVLRALDPSARLVFLQLLSESAAEVTGRLQRAGLPAVYEVRLEGREPVLSVEAYSPADTAAPRPEAEPDEAGTARITLRLPDAIKTRADEAAGLAGVSLNAFIVAAVRQATAPRTAFDTPAATATRARGHRMSGWL